MASPQTENGHTRIANELLEALTRFDFSKRQYKVLLAVMRKTYGFGKKEDDLGITQLAKLTGLDHAHAARTVRELVDMKVLYRKAGSHAHVIGLAKDYSKWGVAKTATPGMAKTAIGKYGQNSHRTMAEAATPSMAKTATTKENHPKENPKRKNYIPPPQIDLGQCDSETSAKSGGGDFHELREETGENPKSGKCGATENEKIQEELIFPKELSKPERQAAEQLLTKCNGRAQEILDALDAAILAGQVKKSPLSLLGGIVRRFEAGTFDPAPGMHIAIERRKKKQAIQQQIAAVVDSDAVLRELQVLHEQQQSRKQKGAP